MTFRVKTIRSKKANSFLPTLTEVYLFIIIIISHLTAFGETKPWTSTHRFSYLTINNNKYCDMKLFLSHSRSCDDKKYYYLLISPAYVYSIWILILFLYKAYRLILFEYCETFLWNISKILLEIYDCSENVRNFKILMWFSLGHKVVKSQSDRVPLWVCFASSDDSQTTAEIWVISRSFIRMLQDNSKTTSKWK